MSWKHEAWLQQSMHPDQGRDDYAKWQCGHCSTYNWMHWGAQKKNCRTCEMKKSYKEVAEKQSTLHNLNTASQNSVKAKLEEVAAQLQVISGTSPSP